MDDRYKEVVWDYGDQPLKISLRIRKADSLSKVDRLVMLDMLKSLVDHPKLAKLSICKLLSERIESDPDLRPVGRMVTMTFFNWISAEYLPYCLNIKYSIFPADGPRGRTLQQGCRDPRYMSFRKDCRNAWLKLQILELEEPKKVYLVRTKISDRIKFYDGHMIGTTFLKKDIIVDGQAYPAWFLPPNHDTGRPDKAVSAALSVALNRYEGDASNFCGGSDGLCEVLRDIDSRNCLGVVDMLRYWLQVVPLPLVIISQHNLTHFYASPSFWTKCRTAWLRTQIEILKD